MIGNIIQSYLVSLGVQIDKPGFQQADHTIRETGANIERVTSGMARNFVKASTIISSALAGVTASAIGLMKATANQDLAMQKYARSMMMSEDAAWRMKKATDALGESINDIALTPELLGRFNKLTADGAQMKVGGDFKETMKDFRDLIFEFTRLKQEASYALNWVGYYLMKYLQKPLADIREKFKSFNDMVIKNMSKWTEKVARGIYYVIEVGRHFLEFIWDVGKHLKNLWDSFPKGAKIAIAAITAINVALAAGPLGRGIMLISTLLLLIDDYYGYMEGKDALLGKYWDKLNYYLEKANEWYEQLKKTAAPYWDMVVEYAQKAYRWISEVVSQIKEWAETSGKGLLDGFIAEAKDVADILWENVKVIWEVITTIAKLATEHTKHSNTFSNTKDIFVKIARALQWVWDSAKKAIRFIQQLIRELMRTQEMRDFIEGCLELYDALTEMFGILTELVEVAFKAFFGEVRKTDILHMFLGVLRLILNVLIAAQKYTKFWVDRLRDLFTLLKNNKWVNEFFKRLGNEINNTLNKLGKFARALAAVLDGRPKDAWKILMEGDKSKGRNGKTKGLTDTEKKWEPYIQAAASKYGVNANLLRAIMKNESGGDETAVSGVGAIGLMQLMPETAAGLGVNPHNPQENIEGGAKYLRQMLDRYNGDERKAIAAYNAGPGAVDDYGGIPPYAETQNYVENVLSSKADYERNTTYGSGKWADAFADFDGMMMDNGSKGCVEAATRMGEAAGNSWLTKQREAGVLDGDMLVENAKNDGLNVIPFDPALVEEGDLIIYDNYKKPDPYNRHTVVADGQGGVWGNSSSQLQVMHYDSYYFDKNLTPARIIKTSQYNTPDEEQSAIDVAKDTASDVVKYTMPGVGPAVGAAAEAVPDIIGWANPGVGAAGKAGAELGAIVRGKIMPTSSGFMESNDSSHQWGLSGTMARLRDAFLNLPKNTDIIRDMVAGYHDYTGAGGNTQNINIDVGGITIQGEGKTNADVGRVAAETIGKELQRYANFHVNNTVVAGGPTLM